MRGEHTSLWGNGQWDGIWAFLRSAAGSAATLPHSDKAGDLGYKGNQHYVTEICVCSGTHTLPKVQPTASLPITVLSSYGVHEAFSLLPRSKLSKP